MIRYLCYKGHAPETWYGDTPEAVCPRCGSVRIGVRVDSQRNPQVSSQGSSQSEQGSTSTFSIEVDRQEEIEFDVLTRDEDDSSESFNSVRLAPPISHYAFIDEIQVTEGRDGDSYEIAFLVIDVAWFDKLRDDMRGMTPRVWSRSALESKPARIELFTSGTRLQEIVDHTGGAVSFYAGNWVLLTIETYDPKAFDGEGLPVTVFPCDGPLVSSLGLSGPWPKPCRIVRIERIRPTSDGLRKLRLFKQAISTPE
ncbi:hypothetical protein ACLESO_48550 [Pyxidicoccus sp. 3LG]